MNRCSTTLIISGLIFLCLGWVANDLNYYQRQARQHPKGFSFTSDSGNPIIWIQSVDAKRYTHNYSLPMSDKHVQEVYESMKRYLESK